MAIYDEAASYGEKAQQIAKSFPSDQYLYFKSLAGLGYLYWVKGEPRKALEIGRRLLKYGEKHQNSRSKVIGHFLNSLSCFLVGDVSSSIKSGEKAFEVAEDPNYINFGRTAMGMARMTSGEFREEEEALEPVIDFNEKRGGGVFLVWAYIFLGPALIAQGRMNQGMELFEKARKIIIEGRKKICEAYYEYALGKTYSLIATGPKLSLSTMVKNIGFLLKNVPIASKKAVDHLNRAIEFSEEIGANGPLGLAYLDLGLFYKSKKEPNQAREHLSQAIHLFEQSEAETYLKQAREALASLE